MPENPRPAPQKTQHKGNRQYIEISIKILLNGQAENKQNPT
jgi:hypothetical protein